MAHLPGGRGGGMGEWRLSTSQTLTRPTYSNHTTSSIRHLTQCDAGAVISNSVCIIVHGDIAFISAHTLPPSAKSDNMEQLTMHIYTRGHISIQLFFHLCVVTMRIAGDAYVACSASSDRRVVRRRRRIWSRFHSEMTLSLVQKHKLTVENLINKLIFNGICCIDCKFLCNKFVIKGHFLSKSTHLALLTESKGFQLHPAQLRSKLSDMIGPSASDVLESQLRLKSAGKFADKKKKPD